MAAQKTSESNEGRRRRRGGRRESTSLKVTLVVFVWILHQLLS